MRFSISDLSPPHTRLLRCLYRERAAISLFDALNSSPSNGPLTFPPEVITRVSQTLARFKSIANDYGVPAEHISVFATEAMRKSENAASMLDAIRAASGLGVNILAPEVETLFGAMGARSGFATVNGLFLDLGGGSVQMTYLDSSSDDYGIAGAQTGKSLPFGAARLIRILEDSETQTQGAALDSLREGMRSAFVKLQDQFASLSDTQANPGSSGVDIYLCGGGFRGYGSILMHSDTIQPYPIPAIGAYTVEGAFFRQTEYMRKVNIEYEDKIYGMSKRRRQQFPAIATVVEALIEAIPRIRTVTFCSGGNREGALYMKLPKAMREESPLPLLYQASSKMKPEAVQAVMDILQASLPDDHDFSHIPTVFTLGLGPLFASNIWARAGEPSEANAAYELHQAVYRDPSAPGFSHIARAVLALTLCSRWGAGVGPTDKLLHTNLQKLINRSNPEANFWAEYIGTIASLLTLFCSAEPNTADRLRKTVKFSSRMKSGKAKAKLQLTISLSSSAHQALDTQGLASYFKGVGTSQDITGKPERKIEFTVQRMEF